MGKHPLRLKPKIDALLFSFICVLSAIVVNTYLLL